MGKSYKVDKSAEDIKYALVEILRDIKDPRVSQMLSIVHVDLTNDLSQVKVYVSAIEGFETTKKSVEGLKSAAGFVRRELAHRVKMRAIPEVIFVADNSIEHSAHINSLILKFNQKDD
ncbi:MAG: 30S ribosome-binding factor RbfA [Oscillospiraceae bacterium]|nr:30S ribosome-binding factor RbfA [Oscillospiraceae bacterium]